MLVSLKWALRAVVASVTKTLFQVNVNDQQSNVSLLFMYVAFEVDPWLFMALYHLFVLSILGFLTVNV